jgi:hypothetical protein
MVQRFRVWRIRGQVLENPLLESGHIPTDSANKNDSNADVELGLAGSSLVLIDRELDLYLLDSGDDDDDDSAIIEA